MPPPTTQLLQNGPTETAPLGVSHECANAERMATLLITHHLAFRKRSILAIPVTHVGCHQITNVALLAYKSKNLVWA
jgi:hypothetical protein